MIIDCISDTHGFFPKLTGGDLLIVAGDLTASDTPNEHGQFIIWLADQEYKKKIYIAGNHDNYIYENGMVIPDLRFNIEYLCDSGTEFEGLKIWGSPWTKTFPGMNPHCKAFTCETEKELVKKFALIPDDVDILIAHSPPFGIMDEVQDWSSGKIKHVGSVALWRQFKSGRINPKLVVMGHIHEGYGIVNFVIDMPHTTFINASHVNERYQPVNKPIRIEI